MADVIIINGIKPIKSEPYNSNNAWGFGGARGTKYTYESGAVLFIGFAGSRHQGESRFHTVTDKNGTRQIDRPGLRVDIHDPEIIKLITDGVL